MKASAQNLNQTIGKDHKQQARDFIKSINFPTVKIKIKNSAAN